MTKSERPGEYLVVLNDEAQYSIWPATTPSPPGWLAEGTRGGKQDCLDHIERVWRDVRPLSVRRRLGRDGADTPVAGAPAGGTAPAGTKTFRPVDRLVADRARLHPDRPAVTDARTSLTYGELAARAEDLAAVLHGRGVRLGDAVAVHMRRGAALVVVLMAVARAGGSALMLDVGGPEQWLKGFVDQARPVVWITHEQSAEPPFGGPVCRVDASGRATGPEAAPEPEAGFPALVPEDTACLVQTSGSTGEPKLVRVPHRTWAFACVSQRGVHRIDAAERGAWLFPSHSCVSVSTLLWPFLAAGAHVSVPPDDLVNEPARLAAWIREERVTQFFAVAPLAEALARLEWPPSPLRLMLTGSDRVREWGSAGLPFEIANWYGTVEVNIVTSAMIPWEERLTSATAGPAERSGPPPIGRAWPGTTWRVVDSEGQPVEVGGIGELVVGGAQLAIGYLSPRATAEKFLPDASAEVPGSRVYPTGDLVRLRADGVLEHRGRLDEQVKINGNRVAMAEVEQALLTCPGITEAAAAAVASSTGRAQLVGYVVTGTAVTDIELRRALADALPAYMVPVAFVRLASLPRSRGDKIDRRALPHPDTVPTGGGDPLVALAAEILAEVLDRPTCAPDDNFFLLGGDSMLAAAAARGLSERTGGEVSIEDVLLHPTPRELAVRLRAPAQGRPDRDSTARG
ncbi:AMP-binding protein [Streptomyces sp. NPDC091383]|uniref:AMP-binding protein n=1 Tax=Streptomyces sp. NPDC091383 TaxID=3365996 RepID=UPI00380051E2